VAERTRATSADRVPIAKTRYFDGTPKEINYVPKPVYRGIQVFENLDVHEQFTDAVNAVSFRKSPDDPTGVSFVPHVEGGPHVASKQNPSEVEGIPVQYERKDTESKQTKTDENASDSQGSVESVETASSFDPDDLRAGARIDTKRNRSSGYATLTGTFFSEDRDDIYLLTADHAASSTDLYRGRTGEKIAKRELRLDGDDIRCHEMISNPFVRPQTGLRRGCCSPRPGRRRGSSVAPSEPSAGCPAGTSPRPRSR
jgi:hypothetical protein